MPENASQHRFLTLPSPDDRPAGLLKRLGIAFRPFRFYKMAGDNDR
jgi:hypothetical protein